VSHSGDLVHTVVLKRGNAFLVTTPEGVVPLNGEHPLGLYLDDCRFLSGHEIRVGGTVPRLLVASAHSGAEAVHELTNPELSAPGGQVVAAQTLQVRIERTIAGEARLRERVGVSLHGRERVALDVEVALSADFGPMLSLRGLAPMAGAEVRCDAVDGGVRFSARGADGVLRATTVTVEPAPDRTAGGRLTFGLRLEPGERRDLLLTYDLHQDEAEPPERVPTRDGPATDGRPAARVTQVRSDDELFDRVLERSLLDVRMLGSRLDGQDYYAAGIPWYCTLFGRDSLITAYEMLAWRPAAAEHTLRLLAGRLGTRADPAREEEPGKVLHELRLGEVAALELTPLARYYGTVDATPLFLCLLAEHAGWSGSLALFRELRPAVDAALGWIDRHGDHDGDGLIDYRASVPEGLRNQGWKDSPDGVPDERGEPLDAPIALVEAQGYVVAAKRGLAPLYRRDGNEARAAQLDREAGELQHRLERFWLAERGFYAMALDGDGRASRALASNQGHLLWAGAIAPERAVAVRDALMGPGLLSGWGIRTLGEGEAGFNPLGYHLGTVWPHDTAMAAAGLRRYGFEDDCIALFEALLEAASHADGLRLPELYAGYARSGSEIPVPYPVACRPQAWAAGAIPYLLTSALGLRADGLDRRLVVRRPTLPRWVGRVEVEDLRIAGARVDLVFERAGGGDRVALTDARIDGDLEVTVEVGRPGPLGG
jgi:glycogen debranching enzyme